MKKIYLYIACPIIALLLALGGSVYASDAAMPKEAYILKYLGLIELSEEYNPNAEVTRAEFAEYLYKAFCLPDTEVRAYFYDVPITHRAAKSISVLTDSRIIDLSDDGNFYPDSPVTYEQVCKMLVAALGYRQYVDYDQDGMFGYVTAASRIGFGMSVSNADALKLGEIISMLYHALDSEPARAIGVQNGAPTVAPLAGKTYFSEYYSVYTDKGRVISVYGASVSEEYAEENEVIIDGITYTEISGLDMESYLGGTVEFVYREDDSDVKTIIYAESVNSNDRIQITYDCIEEDVSDNTIRYMDNTKDGRVRSVKIDNAATIVLNGRVHANNDMVAVIGKFAEGALKGSVTLVRSHSGAGYDTVLIYAAELYMAGVYNSQSEILYDFYGEKAPLDLTEYETVIIKDEYGAAAQMPLIYPTPLLIAKSADSSVLTITVCNRVGDGTLTMIQSDRTVYIDESEAKIDRNVYEHIKNSLVLNASYSLKYDPFGEIVWIEKVIGTDAFKIGYLLKTGKVAEDAFENTYQMRLYTEDGKFEEYLLENKIIIDGVAYNIDDFGKLFSAFPGSVSIENDNIKIERQLIRFKLNADNKIKEIDTYYISELEDANTTLSRGYDGSTEMVYCGSSGRLGMNTLLDKTGTMVFVVPNVDADGNVISGDTMLLDTEDLYGISYIFTDWQRYTAETYKYKADTAYVDVAVVHSEPRAAIYDMIMFDSIVDSLNTEGEVVKKLIGFSLGQRVEYVLDDDCIEDAMLLKQGDLFTVSTFFNSSLVAAINKVFDAQTRTFEANGAQTDRDRYWYGGTFVEGNAANWRNEDCNVTKGYAYENKNGIITSSYELWQANDGIITEAVKAATLPIVVYDSSLKKNNVYLSDINSVITFKNNAGSCDLMLTCSKKAAINQIFIIR